MSAAKHIREPRADYLTREEPALLRGFELLATAEGGVAALRELVLTLALHGKMVDQFGSDEPADVLLSGIQSSPPNKTHVTNFTSERPFEVPSSWVWATLGEVIDVVRGITFPANQKTREPASDRIACLRTTNVQSDVEWDDLLFVDRSFVKREEQIIQHLDIVMSMANSKALVGKVALVEEIPWPEATIGGFLAVLRPRLIDARYVMIVMRSRYARSALIDSASQTTNIANISLAKLRPLPFPLPPLAEQHRIVARVEELMTLCDALEARGRLVDGQHARLTTTLFDALTASNSAQTLADSWQRIATHFDLLLDRPQAIDALEQTILQLAVRGLLVRQDPADEPAGKLLARIRAEKERLVRIGKVKRDKPINPLAGGAEPFELPESWKWARLGCLGESFVYGTSEKSDNEASGVPVLRMGNIQNGEVVMENLKYMSNRDGEVADLFLRPCDLLFNRTNSYELVGKTGIFEGFERDVTFASYLIKIRVADAFCSARYINLYMNTMDCRKNEIEPGLTQQTGQANFNGTKLRDIRVPLPPLAEQHRIVARVEQLRSLCANLRERLNKALATQTHLTEALVTEAVQPQRGVRLG